MGALIASLPWYELPRTSACWDRIWAEARGVLERGGVEELPVALDRGTPLAEQWRDPRLVLSQCCGSDLFLPGGAYLKPVGRPVFADLDCEPGDYFSHIVAPVSRYRASRYRASRLAVNGLGVRSGYFALIEWLAERGHDPEDVVVTGSHAASLDALRAGLADIAAIDAFSWKLLDTRGVVVLGRSAPAPAPPFVMHRDSSVGPAKVFEALRVAIERRGAAVALEGIMPARMARYRCVFQAGCEVAASFPNLAKPDSLRTVS